MSWSGSASGHDDTQPTSRAYTSSTSTSGVSSSGVSTGPDRILRRSERLFHQFAMLSAVTYMLVATGTMLVLGGTEGGWRAIGAGLMLVAATGLLLIPTFRNHSERVQAGFGALAAVPAGLAAVPPGWEHVGVLTMAHPVLSLGAGAVLATTTAVGFTHATPAALVATTAAGWATTQAGMDYSAKSAAGILVVWIGGGLLVTATRTGFGRAIAATAAAVDAEAALSRRREVWEARKRRNRLLHDTVLATADLLARSGGDIDPASARAAALRDIDVLDGRRPARPPSSAAKDTDAPDSALLAAMKTISAEFAASGLLVELSVGESLPAVEAWVCDEAAWAVHEALRNVQRHSGVDRADLSLSAADDRLGPAPGQVVVLTVVDSGRGFDVDAVGAERLGLSGSITERIQDVGGRSRIWSSPGNGCTVMISIPASPPAGDGARARTTSPAVMSATTAPSGSPHGGS